MKKSKYIFLTFVLLLCTVVFSACTFPWSPKKVSVTGITLNKEILYVALNEENVSVECNTEANAEKLIASVVPANATNKNISFSSTNTGVANIENNQIVAVAVGSCVITATSADGKFEAHCTICVIEQSVQVSAITNLSFDGEKVVWSKPENANYGFVVKINDVEQPTTVLTSFSNFETGVQNTISVKALGNGTGYKESEYSSNLVFTKLNTPQNVSHINLTLSWNAVEGASGYEVFKDSSTEVFKTVVGNSVNFNVSVFSDLENHTFSVKAIPSAVTGGTVYSSNKSEIVNVQKLATPSNLKMYDGVINFNANTQTKSYSVQIDGTKEYNTGTNNYWTVDELVTSGDHYACVKAVGDESRFISSDYSSVPLFFNKLSAVTNVRAENNIIKWDTVDSASGYVISINNKQIDLGTSKSYFLGELYDAGDYVIKVRCTGLTTKYVASNFSSDATFKKLSTPDSFKIEEGKVKWVGVEGARSYNLSINGTDVVVDSSLMVNNEFSIIPTLSAGNYNIKIQAVGDGTSNIISNYSESLNTQKLDTPITPSLNNGIVEWNPVSSAVGYVVKINNEDTLMNNLSIVAGKVTLDLSDETYSAQNYSISVKAIAGGQNLNGEFSAISTFAKLNTPTNVSAYLGELAWNYDSNVSDYGIIISGKEISQNISEANRVTYQSTEMIVYSLSNIPYSSAEIAVQIYAKGNSENYITSSCSTTKSFLMQPSITDLTIEGNVLSFTKPESVQNCLIGYTCKTSGGSSVKQNPVVIANNSISLPNFNGGTLSAGDYTFKIIPQGNSDRYLNGEEQEISTEILSCPTDFKIDKGALAWNASSSATGYELQVTGEGVSGEQISKTVSVGNVGTCTINNITSFKTNTDYVVSIKTLGNGSQTISSEKSTGTLTVSILSAPSELRVENGNVAWNEVTNSTKYNLSIDGTLLPATEETQDSLESGISAGEHLIKVCAYGDSTKYLTSLYCTAKQITKLGTPANLKVAKNLEQKPTLTCDTPNNSTLVKLFEKKDNNDETSEDYSNALYPTQITKDLSAYTAGYYSFIAQAIGDSDKYVSSNKTAFVATTVMASPESISANSGKISWSSVSGVSYYKVEICAYTGTSVSDLTISGEPQVLDNLNNTLLALGTEYQSGFYKLKIMAVGDESKFISSVYSQETTFFKLTAPTALAVANGLVLWNSVTNANGYSAYVDEENQDDTINAVSYELSESVAVGEHTVKMQALGDDTIYLTSELSDEINVVKLANANNFMLSNGIVSWTQVVKASGYELKVDNSAINTNLSKVELTDEDAGNHSIKLKVIGGVIDGVNYVNSNYSANLEAVKLNQVENFTSVNGLLSWASVENASAYILRIAGLDEANSSFSQSFETELTSYELDSSVPAGRLQIDVRAKGNSSDTSGQTYYLNGNTSGNKTFTKLNIQTNLRVSENKFLWTNPESESGFTYEISVNKANTLSTENVDVTQLELDSAYSSGSYRIKIKTVGNVVDDVHYLNSNFTSEVSAVKPEKITGFNNNDGTITWNAVSDASSYVVKYYYRTDTGSYDKTVDPVSKSISEETLTWYLSKAGWYDFSVFAVGENGLYSDAYSGEIHFDYLSGAGIEGNEYIVSNYADLLKIGKFPYAKYKLSANIVVTNELISSFGSYTPVYNTDLGFMGSFSGNNYTITGLQINNLNLTNAGLFAKIGTTGVVNNVKLINIVYNLSAYNLGGIAGINCGTISNCSVSGTISVTNGATNQNKEIYAGGIAGINSSSSAIIKVEATGLAGYATDESALNNGIIKNCESAVSLSGNATECYNIIGGIVGKNAGGIQNCVVSGGTINGNQAGGIAGINNRVIFKCINKATKVTGSNAYYSPIFAAGYSGGIAGYNTASSGEGLIVLCLNKGVVYVTENVNVTNSIYAGGIVGYNHSSSSTAAKVFGCVNQGTVSAVTSGTNTAKYVSNLAYNSSTAEIKYCYYVQGTVSIYGNTYEASNNAGETVANMNSETFATLINGKLQDIVNISASDNIEGISENSWVLSSGELTFA